MENGCSRQLAATFSSLLPETYALSDSRPPVFAVLLGIAAALTGAKSVYMCDIDPQAVEAARANAALNGVDCTIERADLIEGKERADLILANLTADILSRLAPSVGEHLNGGGEIVASGIIAERLDEVKGVFAAHGFRVIEERADGDWRALRLGR